jgi:hypothetical protein
MDTPDDEFAKIDQMLPKKKNQTPRDRARDIEGALDWIRNTTPVESGDTDTPPFKKLPNVPGTRRSPEDRQADVDNILNWLRNGKDEINDKTGEFDVIDQLLPKKPLQQPSNEGKGY